MLSLLEHQMFSLLSENLNITGSEISSTRSRILIVSEPSLVGSIAIASIECALLDSSIPYRRRFSFDQQSESPIIRIHSNPDHGDPFFQIHPLSLSLQSQVVEGLRGSSGDSRNGPLTVIPQAFALAQKINPESPRLRRMKPWILAGNWLANTLDTTYDAVYSSLRDFLSLEGSVRIVPFPEVSDLHLGNYPWMDEAHYRKIIDGWNDMDLEEKEQTISSSVKAVLSSSTPSTSRLEELVWHCVLGTGWKSDLASQILLAESLWVSLPPIVAACKVADQIVGTGVFSLLKS
ncbi:MAG TPA: hypothetical protein QF703_02485 [Candidatus Thalassarchaeaceae archaeon]|nr:hypothetical protein [Candidatus Thalassarchaeaceae archaeon]